jgi:hypothetical protein
VENGTKSYMMQSAVVAFNDTANKLLRIGNLAPTATSEEFTQCMLNLDPVFILYDIKPTN